MNEVIKTILQRRAVRKYEDRPVSREDLELIVKCGQYAATGMGIQPWHFTVVTDRAVLDQLNEANKTIMLADPNTPVPVLDMIRSGQFDTYRGAPCAVLVSGETRSRTPSLTAPTLWRTWLSPPRLLDWIAAIWPPTRCASTLPAVGSTRRCWASQRDMCPTLPWPSATVRSSPRPPPGGREP